MRIAVLGAGVVGTTCAYELMRDGHEVVVVDKAADAALGTSFGNAGFISPGHAYAWASPKAPGILLKSLWRGDQALRFKPSADPALWRWMVKFLGQCTAERAAWNTGRKVGLCVYSKERLNLIAAESGIAFDHLRKGCLYLFRSEAGLAAGARKAGILIDRGVAVETIDMERAAALDPALEGVKDRFAGALFTPGDETGDCRTFVQRLAAHLAERGADVRFGTTVRRIETEGDRAVRAITDKTPIEADAFVLSLGVGSPAFGRVAGVDLPIYPVKGYSITAPVAGRNRAPVLGGIDEENLIAWARYGERIRVTATAEFAGHATTWRDADFRQMDAVVRELFPDGADWDRAERWAGLRPMTPSGLPIYGRGRLANLWMNTGQGHMGWTMGAGSARITADLIAGRAPEIDTEGMMVGAGPGVDAEGGMTVLARAGAGATGEVAPEAPVVDGAFATQLIEHIPFETDQGVAARARLGAVVLSGDYTIEHEFRAVLARLPGVALYVTRIFCDSTISPETLSAMEDRVVPAAGLLLPGDRFDVMAFGCTSAAMVLGETRIFELLREAKPEARPTTPVTAAFAAFRALGARRIGVLTPYSAEVNATVKRYIEGAGFDIPVFGSFNEGHDPTVAAISPASVRAAAIRIAGAAPVDAIFVSCTSVRLLEAAQAIETELGVPVTSSNHAMIWHCLRLAGIGDTVPGLGRLFGLPLA